MPALRYIGVLATGYNVVEVEAARERGIPVSNVPTYGARSVAQMALAHLLNLTQHVAHHARTVAEGRWSRMPGLVLLGLPARGVGRFDPGDRGAGPDRPGDGQSGGGPGHERCWPAT